jgi:uncharacterized protein (AIM24 family)
MKRINDFAASGVAALVAAIVLLGADGTAEAQQHLWSRGFGGTGATDSVIANAVRDDQHGGVVIGGSFQGTCDLGLGSMRSWGGPDGLVASFSNADGTSEWKAQIGGQGASTNVTSIAVDRSGDVYAAGWFSSTIFVSGQPLTSAGGTDAFLVKYDGSSGAPIWYLAMGGSGPDKAYAVMVDTSGDVVVTGFFTGSASFGGAALNSAGSTDVFLAKYAGRDGRVMWSKRMGGTGSDIGTGLAPGLIGDIVVTGTFSSSVDFGGGAVQSAGGTDVFLVTYNASGSHVWTRAAGGTGDDAANAVGTDADGNPVFTGNYINTVDFGGGGISGSSAPSIFLAKYAATDGAYLWAKGFRSPILPLFGGSGRGIAVHSDGSIALTGSITDDVDFGGGGLGGDYTADIFLAEFSPAGQHRWSRRFVATFRDEGEGIAFDTAGNFAAAGVFANAVNLGGDMLSPGGSNNAFVARFASSVTQTNPPTATAAPQTPTPTFTQIPGTPTRTPTFTRTPSRTPTAQSGSASGAITYYSNNQVVPAAEVKLEGPLVTTVETNAQGQYAAAVPLGTWSIAPAKTGGFGSAVSSLDAARVLQALAGVQRFTDQQRLACDASGDGTLSTLDAVYILQFSAGLLERLPAANTCGSDWIFYPSAAATENQQLIYPALSAGQCQQGAIILNPLVGTVSGQDFDGILLGDCTGNWTSGMALRQRARGEAVVHAGFARRRQRDFVIPVYVKSAAPFQALDLRLSYDPAATFVGATARGQAASAITSTQNDAGRVSLSLASAASMAGNSGAVVLLRFRGADPKVELDGAMVDEELARVLTHRRAH